ncbi:MAG: hypothetical protein KUG52_02460 [Immundisolibacteraceae bacterium]|nr:hypothetical protein [Immundisolibacteraceae bacterium]
MKKIKLSGFPAQSLKLIESIQANGESFQITKDGIVVAELTPPGVARADTLVGFMRGSMVIKGDVISPVLSLAKKR